MSADRDTGMLMIKPDGIRAGARSRARSLAREAGLAHVTSWTCRIDLGHVLDLWPMVDARARPITHFLLGSYLIGNDVEVDVFTGADALDACLSIKDVLRREVNDTIYANTVHSPDRPAEVVEQQALLSAPGRRPSAEPTADAWHGWTRVEVRSVTDNIWARLAGRPRVPDHWALRAGAGRRAWADSGPGTVLYVGATWNFGFDALVVGMAQVLGTRDLDAATCAALAALYDDTGFHLPETVADPDAARVVLTPLGVLDVPADRRADAAALLAGRPRWTSRLATVVLPGRSGGGR